MKRLVLITIQYIVIISFCNGQTYPKQEIDLSQLADNLFAIQDLDLNYEALYENIVQQLANPINLNKATSEELRFLNILSEHQVEAFIKYRNENGNLVSIYELQSIEGFDLTTIYSLLPFVSVPDPASTLDQPWLARASTENNNYFISRYERTLQSKKGFGNETNPDSKFLGSPDKLYLRFRASRPGDFSVGFTAKKDEGEELIWNAKQYGFDYWSFHAQIQNKGKLKNLILGDFQNQFAQGLMFGGAFSLGKGAETIATTRRSNIGSTPYTSSSEFGFLRGGIATYEIAPHTYLTGFYSNTKRDGIVSSDSVNDETSTSSFQTTGLHRTKNELAARKTIREINYGAVVNYKSNAVDMGLMLNNITFNSTINRTPSLYNQFSFNGKQNENYGAFLNYTFYNMTWFNEISKSTTGGIGFITGLISSLNKNFDVSMVYRKYDKNYYSFYSNAFSESTSPQNESGTYLGWKYKVNKKISTAGYFDFFQFPWLRYRSYEPSYGHEWLARITYQPSKKIMAYIQIREENKVRNINDPRLFTTAAGTKRNCWINFDYEINTKLKMKTRAQFSTYELNHQFTRGMVLLQDITIDFGKLKLTGRYAFVDTDDYENRQYVYERNVWLAYSLPAYYGVAVRNFILAEYKLNKHWSLWLRYANTKYSNQQKIGSGVDTIDGNTKTDITFQLRLAL